MQDGDGRAASRDKPRPTPWAPRKTRDYQLDAAARTAAQAVRASRSDGSDALERLLSRLLDHLHHPDGGSQAA